MLLSIYTPSRGVARANVVFVHGLGGNGTTYWGKPETGTDFWLHWLGEDLQDIAIWTLEYDANPVEWFGPNMSLIDHAETALNYLRDYSLTNAPLIFVGHSLGGFLLEQMIRLAETSKTNDWQALVPLFRGVCFLGTPHHGRQDSSYIQRLTEVLGVSVEKINRSYYDDAFFDLSRWYQENAPRLGIKTASYFETRKTVRRSHGKFLIGDRSHSSVIVDEFEADPGIQGVRAIGLDHDHFSMVTPKKRNDDVYVGVLAFIKSCFPLFPEAVPSNQEIYTLPYEVSPFFTGHEDEYKKLVETLGVVDSVFITPFVLKGMGGVGKTQLALKFAAEHKKQFPGGIFWIPAETVDGAQQKLLEYATRFAPEVIVEQQPEITALRFCGWLANQEKFLTIFDNADGLEPTKHYAEVLGKSGFILYTTSRQHLPAYVVDIPVKTLSKALGGQLLLKCMGPDHPENSPLTPAERGQDGGEALVSEAEALAERLGGLPLAISQAGAYLKQTGRAIAWYTEQYETQGKLLREKYGVTGQSTEHASVGATFSLALESLEENSPASADLMRVLAFLNPESIPTSLFVAGAKYVGDRLGPLAEVKTEWDRVVESASQLSLIERSEPPGHLNIHRVVQDVVKDTLDEQQKRIWVTAAVGVVASVTPHINSTTWWQPLEISAHWPILTKEALALSIETVELSYVLNAFATWRQYQHIFPRTSEYFQKALAIHEATHGTDHPTVATSLNNLAYLLKTTGKYEDADILYNRAIAVYDKVYGTNHPATAAALNNLAGLFRETSKYEESEKLYRMANSIYADFYKSKHLDIAIVLNNLAGLLRTKKEYKEAEYLYRQALNIRDEKLGADHPDIAQSLNNLAGLLREIGKYQDAERFYRRALLIKEKQLGGDHPYIATSLNNLAGLLHTTRRYQEAELCSRKAFLIILPLLDKGHPNVKIMAQVWLHCLQSAQENKITLSNEVPEMLYEQALMLVNQSAE